MNRGIEIIREKIKILFFTLLELLIVISIIAILAAVLLPALKTAKEIAKEIVCKNNIRQLGLCTFNYADDYKSYAPFGEFSKNYMFSKELDSEIFGRDYIKGQWITVYSGTTPRLLPVLSICPSGKRYDDNTPGTYINPNFSYGYNVGVSGRWSNIPPRKIDIIKTPSRTFFIADTTWGGGGMQASSEFFFRHRTSANISFVDNHVELWKWNKVPVSTSETDGFYYSR